jgi:hypothetical protein
MKGDFLASICFHLHKVLSQHLRYTSPLRNERSNGLHMACGGFEALLFKVSYGA